MTQPSISHAIKALERHCNVDLFVRDNRGVQLTEAGHLLYDSVRSGFQRIEQSLKTITAKDTQYITVATSTSLAAHWLVPKLPIFQQRHPGIKIKIVTTDRDIEPDHQVDMTIWLRLRSFERPNSWYMCEEVIYPVCSPSYMASASPLKSVEDLGRHRLIHSSDPHRKRMGWSEWLGLFGFQSAEVEPNLVFNDYQLAIQAALAGEGVVLGWAADKPPASAQQLLVRPLKEEVRTENAFFVIANDRTSKLDEMKLLVQWVVEEAQSS